jgi:hypothetical protein
MRGVIDEVIDSIEREHWGCNPPCCVGDAQLKVKSFEELWNNPKTKELMKEIVIKRVEQMPDNLLLCFGRKEIK